MKLLCILLLCIIIGDVIAVDRINDVYAVSDSSINDFLEKFIASSVENVTMLVQFITQMLKDAIGSNVALPILNK
jgi:hypothetical protein